MFLSQSPLAKVFSHAVLQAMAAKLAANMDHGRQEMSAQAAALRLAAHSLQRIQSQHPETQARERRERRQRRRSTRPLASDLSRWAAFLTPMHMACEQRSQRERSLASGRVHLLAGLLELLADTLALRLRVVAVVLRAKTVCQRGFCVGMRRGVGKRPSFRLGQEKVGQT